MSNNSAPKEPILDTSQVPVQAQGLVRASIVWLQTHWLQILVAFVIGAVIVIALHGLRRLGQRLCARDVSGTGWGTILGRAVGLTNNFFIVMLAAKLVSGYSGAPTEVATTINFLFTVATVFQAAIWAREVILGAIEHRTEGGSAALGTAMGLIRLLVTFALFAIALVVVLDNLGVNVTGLVAGLGVGGIAIGLAAQGIFADLFAALAIIFDRPFRRGDNVSYDQTSGTIETIGLKSTRIRAFTGELRVISNRNLLDKEIQNTTRRNRVRIAFTLRIPYETAPDTLEQLPAILTDVVEGVGGTVSRAGFETFGENALEFALQFDTPGDDWGVANALRDKIMVGILRRFAEENIRIAYPTQTTYSAAPDGRLVMPFAEPQPVSVEGPVRVEGASSQA